MFKLNVFLIRFLPYLYTARIWLNLITSKAFRSSRSQMFYKIGVLKNFAKFTGEQLCCSYFLIRTPIFSSPLKSKQHFFVNKLTKWNKGDNRTCVRWYFTKDFSELSYHFFSQSPPVVFWLNCAFPLSSWWKWKW